MPAKSIVLGPPITPADVFGLFDEDKSSGGDPAAAVERFGAAARAVGEGRLKDVPSAFGRADIALVAQLGAGLGEFRRLAAEFAKAAEADRAAAAYEAATKGEPAAAREVEREGARAMRAAARQARQSAEAFITELVAVARAGGREELEREREQARCANHARLEAEAAERRREEAAERERFDPVCTFCGRVISDARAAFARGEREGVYQCGNCGASKALPIEPPPPDLSLCECGRRVEAVNLAIERGRPLAPGTACRSCHRLVSEDVAVAVAKLADEAAAPQAIDAAEEQG